MISGGQGATTTTTTDEPDAQAALEPAERETGRWTARSSASAASDRAPARRRARHGHGELKPVGHEDRLTLVEHLDELRTRLIICVVAFVVAFGVCLWQNDVVLDIINRPLEQTAFEGVRRARATRFEQTDCLQQAQQQRQRASSPRSAASARRRRPASEPRAARRWPSALASGRRAAARGHAAAGSPKRPVTLGVGEPFTATVRVAAYAALLLSLPLLLFQVYAFVLPAFSPARAAGRAAADDDGAVPVHRAASSSRTSWSCRRRSTSCRTSTTTTSTSCSRRGTTTSSRSCCWR